MILYEMIHQMMMAVTLQVVMIHNLIVYTVQEPDDSLSDAEVDGNDNSTPIGWMIHYPISRERFPFTVLETQRLK